jgi:hypothetical protein
MPQRWHKNNRGERLRLGLLHPDASDPRTGTRNQFDAKGGGVVIGAVLLAILYVPIAIILELSNNYKK